MNKHYETPVIEITEVISEGVLCGSGPKETDNSFNYYDDEIGW